MKKDLTKIGDLTAKDVTSLIDQAFEYKRKHDSGIRREEVLGGRVVAMIFEKPSLRTKVAFEVATAYLGGSAVFLSSSQILASGGNQRGRESIPDIARNLERFADMIIARVYSHDVIKEMAQAISIPVINALCDRHHPTQALADLMAVKIHKPEGAKLRVAFVGDGNNVCTSLMQICAMMGIDFSAANPLGYEVLEEEKRAARVSAQENGSLLEFVRDPAQAVCAADVVYTDTFVSMGQEDEQQERHRAFVGYQVNTDLMSRAKPDAVFMHCLPAHRGEEVTNEVMDSDCSIVFDQAGCRLHIAKAVVAAYAVFGVCGGELQT